MKKIPIIFLVSIFLGSCQKNFLSRAPMDSYSNATLWKSESDAMASLNGCYSGWEYGDNVVYDDCITDNAYDQFPWEGYETYASGLATPSNTGVNKYDYTTIQRCNWFLDNIDKVPDASFDPASLKARMKAEARFIRAYKYFVLTQDYGDVPFVLHSITPQQADTLSRTPKAQITSFVLSELGAIANDLPTSYSGSDIGRITKGAALSLKARIELYNQKYADCIADCKAVMDLGVYSLYPSYGDLFRPQNADNQEVILDVQYLLNLNPAWVQITLAPNSCGGWSSIAPTQSLVDAYETINGKTIQDDPTYNPLEPYKNRDPRLSETILYPGESYLNPFASPQQFYFDPLDKNSADVIGQNNASPTGYNFKKYIQNLNDLNGTSYGNGDLSNTGQTFILIRYAEILLTDAEAKIESDQIDASVYNDINAVRQRAGMPVVTAVMYPDQASLRTLVRRERRVEFAGEGLRWYDIQRWKIGETVMNGTVYGCPNGPGSTVNETTGATTLIMPNAFVAKRQFDPAKNYLWPIPQKEVDIEHGNGNSNFKNNPGY